MKKLLLGATLLFTAVTGPGLARAQEVLVDDVETSIEAEWAQIRVHFTMPVNYIRHFPLERGQQLQIFFTVVGLGTQDISLRDEVRMVDATPVMPGAKITFSPPLSLNLQRDPSSLSVQFSRVANYSVRPGKDNRSLVIYLPIVPVEKNPAAPGTKN